MGKKLVTISAFFNLFLAVVAAVASFLLFQTRAALRDQAEKNGVAISNMMTTMDENSGTVVASEVNLVPRDKVNKTPDSGSLSWKNYQEAKDEDGSYASYQAILAKAEAQTKEVMAQRNELAKYLMQTGTNMQLSFLDLGIGGGEDFTNISATQEDSDNKAYIAVYSKIAKLAAALKDRDDALIATLTKINADVNNNNLDTEPLTSIYFNGDDVSFNIASLGRIETGVKNNTKRATAMVEVVSQMVEIIDQSKSFGDIDVDALSGDRYGAELTVFEDAFEEINDELKKAKKIISDADKFAADMQELKAQLAAKDATILGKEKFIARYEAILKDPKITKILEDSGEEPEIDPHVTGTVLAVEDEDFGFVILDLGVTQKIKVGEQFIVKRGTKLIARLVLKDIREHETVALVTSKYAHRKIQKGDKVAVSFEEILDRK